MSRNWTIRWGKSVAEYRLIKPSQTCGTLRSGLGLGLGAVKPGQTQSNLFTEGPERGVNEAYGLNQWLAPASVAGNIRAWRLRPLRQLTQNPTRSPSSGRR
jgi:hypothetical protein